MSLSKYESHVDTVEMCARRLTVTGNDPRHVVEPSCLPVCNLRFPLSTLSITAEAAFENFQEYRLDFLKEQIRRFFATTKVHIETIDAPPLALSSHATQPVRFHLLQTLAWMLERYHPDNHEAWQARRCSAAAQRFDVFRAILEQGHFENICFDERKHEEITRLSQLINRRLDACQDDRTFRRKRRRG